MQRVSTQLEKELIIYESWPVVNNENEITNHSRALLFFQTNRITFPILRKLIGLILSIPATSVPSEALFSQAGQIHRDLRNRLDCTILEKLNFLRNNIKTSKKMRS